MDASSVDGKPFVDLNVGGCQFLTFLLFQPTLVGTKKMECMHITQKWDS